jgi:hypothetical protein
MTRNYDYAATEPCAKMTKVTKMRQYDVRHCVQAALLHAALDHRTI